VAFSALKGDLMFTLYLAGVRKLLARAAQEQSGQGLSEYALILVLIAIICFVALELLGADLASMLSSAAQAI
jgi:Flp pilus assembly pilin Flp